MNKNELINKKFESTEREKVWHAEFGTPYFLRRDMLNSLPKTFWQNPNRLVLEPCAGKGGFLYDLFLKFMHSLRHKIPDKTKRHKHIVEKILYFADINKRNVKKCCRLLDPDGKYKLNYYVGDTLGDKFKMDIKFDLVVGNPPYNKPGRTETGNTLYQLFIERALMEWVKNGGYLLFVTPPAWRKPVTGKSKNKGMWELMTQENHMIYLEIHDANDGKKTFDAHTRYDWYLIQKKSPKGNGKFKRTEVVDINGEKHSLNLSRFPWLPNSDYKFIQKLFVKKGGKAVDIIGDGRYHTTLKTMSKKKTGKYKYVCVHGTPKTGIKFWYSSIKDDEHFGVPKVIIGNSGVAESFINKKGKYCLTEHAMGIVDTQKNMEKVLRALRTEKMRELLKACLWSSFQIDWRVFLYFKKDFYKYFKE